MEISKLLAEGIDKRKILVVRVCDKTIQDL